MIITYLSKGYVIFDLVAYEDPGNIYHSSINTDFKDFF